MIVMVVIQHNVLHVIHQSIQWILIINVCQSAHPHNTIIQTQTSVNIVI